jgi:hypothetical protein
VKKLFITIVVLLLPVGCSSDLPEIVGCEAVGDIRPVCEMRSPEDIAALDDDRHLLLAHFGHMGEGVGGISLFDTHTELLTPLYPGGAGAALESSSGWGDADCVSPPGESIGPHGTHLHQLEDGRWRYLVVNHGEREAIELFELQNAGADSSLTWRGCVMATEVAVVNDVVGLANGDLVLSQMWKTGSTFEMIKGMMGFSTGRLWRWSSESGLKPVPGTEAGQPNGLEISADNRYLYANMYFEAQTWKIDIETGETVAVAEVANADNSAWSPDGRLWVATHHGEGMQILDCFNEKSRPCAIPFKIVAIDPETMETEVVFAHSGPPMGGATIAVAQGGRVYMGSFAGDRLISVSDFSSKKLIE